MTQSNMSSGRLVCCIASNGTGDDRCIDALKSTGIGGCYHWKRIKSHLIIGPAASAEGETRTLVTSFSP